MIEIFNLGLNTSASRDEMQTQASLWGDGYGLQDPAAAWSAETQAITQLFDILLEVVLDATVCFFTHPEEHVMTMINVFYP